MIRLSEAICKEGMVLNLKAADKVTVIKELAEALPTPDLIDDTQRFLTDILKRENLESTGIGLGVAIPHARTSAARDLILTFGRSANGVDFNSLDGKPAHLIFLIAAPGENKSQYIMALARLSKILRREEARKGLWAAASPAEVVEILKRNE